MERSAERLVGRDVELIALDAWLGDTHALPSMFVIEGDR
jgi:hypothetical protein